MSEFEGLQHEIDDLRSQIALLVETVAELVSKLEAEENKEEK